MNILLINHYAGSPDHGMEYRPYYMARAWAKLGHRTRIVAASFSHLRSRQPAGAEDVHLESVGGIEYCWLRAGAYQGNGLGRIRNMVAFVSGLVRHGHRITHDFKPDAVITSSTYPLDALAGRRIARRYDATLVHEIHDLWPLSPMELGNMSRWHPFIMTMQVAENFAYRHADRVVSMLPAAEQHMREHGLAEGKFVYVPNGLDVSEWEGNRAPVPLGTARALAEFRARHPFLIGYAGSHGIANALEYLVDAAGELRGESVGFVMVGQGPEKAALQSRARALNLENILFVDAVKKPVIPALLADMDALYIGWRRSPLYRFGVSPNKLFDYMMAGKPVIHSIDAANDIVAESRCGVTVKPEDARAVATAVRHLLALDARERREMGERGTRYVLRHHTYDVLATRFVEAVRGAPDRAPAPTVART
jgi:glycosyltransferase involved in cell wall biosynthesis